MPNLIPGLAQLGCCFDIDGEYSPRSVGRQIFAFDETNPTSFLYTYVRDGKEGPTITYLYPPNTKVSSLNTFVGTSNVFADQQEFSSNLNAQAGIGGKVGDRLVSFSGQFSASYSQASESDSSYWYGLYEARAWLWKLSLVQYDAGVLAPWVKDDPLYKNVPTVFLPNENAAKFYRFFDAYGTHFTSSVTAGGRMFYNAIVNRSYSSSKTEMSADLNAEFKAYFVSTTAEASASWEQVSDSWMANRKVEILSEGGGTDFLMTLVPQKPENFHDSYESWLNAVPLHPAGVGYTLTSIQYIFPDVEQQRAVEAAMMLYLRGSIFAESRYESCEVRVMNSVVPNTVRPETSGLQMVITDAALDVVFEKTYSRSWVAIGSEYRAMYREVEADLERFYKSEYVVTMAFFGMAAMFFPTLELRNYMQGLGAGAALKNWEDMSNGGYWTANQLINYALIGVPGTKLGAQESLSQSNRPLLVEGSTNPGGLQNNKDVAPSVDVMARAYKDLDAGGETIVRLATRGAASR